MILIVLYLFLFLIVDFFSRTEDHTTEEKEKTWQEYEAEKPKRSDGKRKVYFEINGKKCKSMWNAGKCKPSTKYKKL